MKKLLPLLAGAFALALTGCGTLTVKKIAADLKEYEQLGVKEIIVTGKFSHTDYTVEYKDGKRTAVINHSNAWVPQIRVVRETDVDDNK